MTGLNRLAKEKSPYLQQHKNNPVDWYPWGDEAFDKARKENKPIFLSIGYSTCHWCHMMEHDSFEIQEVADYLNAHFVSIKVDREERPDIDQIYMDAVVTMTGRGGWPMSVFLTPDLKPFFGGTFFYRDQFLWILSKIRNLWQKDRQKLLSSGEELALRLQEARKPDDKNKDGIVLDESVLKKTLSLFDHNFDEVYGGFGPAPKFPRSIDLSLLLRIHRRTGNDKALHMVNTTLDHMARGGMYDQLGGGFARYSTDDKWLVPHFEKMLYDNALLALMYLEAYQVTHNEMYASVAKEILNYVLRDMTDEQGGFYSAEDADSEGEEGKFYVWTIEELKKTLTADEYSLFSKVYQVTEHGNFSAEGVEHNTNILSLSKNYGWEIKKHPLMISASKKLFDLREKRIHPSKDDKVLTEWNGLMITAMTKGFQVLGDWGYLVAAQKAAHFIHSTLYKDGVLLRRYRDGEAKFEAFLNDYAYLNFGLLNLYESDFNPHWLNWARDLQKKQDELFWDAKEGAYFFTAPHAKDVIVRTKELNDGATPAGNAVAALNLLRLHDFTFEDDYRQRAEKIFSVTSKVLDRYPPGYAMTLLALDYFLDRSQEIVLIGDPKNFEVQEILKYIWQSFLPNKVLAMNTPEGTEGSKTIPLLQDRILLDNKPTVYVCEGNICQKPVHTLEETKVLLIPVKK